MVIISICCDVITLYARESMALGVDAENPSGALKLYEKMGFRVVKKATFYRKPL